MIVAVIIVLLIILLGGWYYRFSPYNTRVVTACEDGTCEKYNVHRQHEDQDAAAKLLREINLRCEKLISFMERQYLAVTPKTGDPTKNNRIDVISGSALYSTEPGAGSPDVAWSEYVQEQLARATRPDASGKSEIRYVQERIVQLAENYDGKNVYEISPLNHEGLTSYTEEKRRLVLCLRKKEKDADGVNQLHDINTMMFVVLHELTHMMNQGWNHGPDFWMLFKFVLSNAVEADVYDPVDYAKTPIIYCGLKLTYNPLFDPKL